MDQTLAGKIKWQFILFLARRLPDCKTITPTLGEMNDPGSMANIDEQHNLYVHCAAGYRSVIASSLLKRQGFHNLRNIIGGWGKIKEQEKADIVKENSVLN